MAVLGSNEIIGIVFGLFSGTETGSAVAGSDSGRKRQKNGDSRIAVVTVRPPTSEPSILGGQCSFL